MFWLKPPAVFSQVFHDAWWRIPTDEKVVYLTFDDGPHPDSTPFILSELARFQFKATFFCTGKQVEEFPSLFEAIQAEGHAVGNHCYDHLNGWRSKTEDYLENISKADALIGSRLFRPPYGKLSWSQWQAVKSNYQIVMWSRMPEDYREDLSPSTLLDRLTDRITPGEIVVLHENQASVPHLTSVFSPYLEHLREHGYVLKSLPTC